jgi:hypothetical protein
MSTALEALVAAQNERAALMRNPSRKDRQVLAVLDKIRAAQIAFADDVVKRYVVP